MHNIHIVNTIQLKILNRKCSFSSIKQGLNNTLCANRCVNECILHIIPSDKFLRAAQIGYFSDKKITWLKLTNIKRLIRPAHENLRFHALTEI